MRICSLLPSATEIVYSLGLGDDLAGVTHECDFPPEAAQLPVLTSSALSEPNLSSGEIHKHISSSLHRGSSIYHLDQHKLDQADPQLILTQELCDVCAVAYGEVEQAVRRLSGQRMILSLEPTTLEGILDTILQVARQAGVPERGEAVVAGLNERIERLKELAGGVRSKPGVFAMEWLDPPFLGGHWVPQMIAWAGGVDVLGEAGARSVQVEWDAIAQADPDVIVLMPCGFSLNQALSELSRISFPPTWQHLRAVRNGNVYAVDGSAYFNRPGPRIVDGLEILGEILHPEIFPKKSPPDAWSRIEAPILLKDGG